jgi:hypothetical protein
LCGIANYFGLILILTGDKKNTLLEKMAYSLSSSSTESNLNPSKWENFNLAPTKTSSSDKLQFANKPYKGLSSKSLEKQSHGTKSTQPSPTPKASFSEWMKDPKKRRALSYGVQIAFSLLTFLFIIILCVLIKPPLVQKTSSDSWAQGQVSWLPIIIWGLIGFLLSFGLAEIFRHVKIG